MNNIEQEIRYRLVKAKGPLVKGDAYYAVLEKGPAADAVAEIAEASGLKAAEIRYVVSTAFEEMARAVVCDGRTRRFGDIFEIGAEIGGGFNRIDAPFDKMKNRLTLTLRAGKALKAAKRETAPVNVRQKSRGRIDYVTWPGGEKGEVKFGEDIVIVGHDLTLTCGDTVRLHTPGGREFGHVFNFMPDGSPARWDDGRIIGNEGFVEWDDNHIRIKWFRTLKPEEVVGKKVTIRFDPWYRDVERSSALRDSAHIGSTAKVVVLA